MFLDHEEGKRFVKNNPSVKFWLDRVSRSGTKGTYAQCLNVFCRSVKLTPEQLMKIRNTPKDQLAELRLKLSLPSAQNGNDDGGYVVLDLLQNFILSGEVENTRTYESGKVFRKVTKIADCSRKYKSGLYYAVLSYFLYNRAALPRDKFTIKDTTKRTEKKTRYMPLEAANAIIAACKSPYKELFTIQKYSGMGSGEILSLNELWPTIKTQLESGENIVKIDFSYRKTNPNAYFTFCPADLLTKFKHIQSTPFTTNRGTPITSADLLAAWKNSMKRTGISERYVPHMFRDLFSTSGLTDAKIGPTYLEFMLGHQVDTNEYRQLYQKPDTVKEEWMKWKRFLDAPVAASAEQVTALEQENKILRDAVVSALLPQKMNLQKLLDDLVAVELRKHHLHGEAGLESLPTKYVTPAMRELDSQIENINQQLEALGWLKRVEPVKTALKH